MTIERLYEEYILSPKTNLEDPQKLLEKATLFNKAYNEEGIQKQLELIKLALDKGAKINNIYSIPEAILFNHYELLLNHETGSLNINKFLDRVIGMYKPQDIQKQLELIKLALDKGAKINDIYSIPEEILFNHYELLLNHETNSLNIDKFLEQILRIGNSQDTQKQLDLINLALDKGAKINNIYSIPEEILFNHYELLLNHETNSLNIDKFLEQILTTHNPKYIKKQAELINLALDKGAKFSKYAYTTNYKMLSENYSILLNNKSNNFESFFIKSLNCFTSGGEDYYRSKASIYEKMYKDNLLNIDDITVIEYKTLKLLKERGIIDINSLFLLALLARDSHSDSIEENSPIIQMFDSFFEQGIKLNDFPLERLKLKEANITILKLLLKNGLNPKALLLSDLSKNIVEIVDLLTSKNVEIPELFFIKSLLSNLSYFRDSDLESLSNIISLAYKYTNFKVDKILLCQQKIQEFDQENLGLIDLVYKDYNLKGSYVLDFINNNSFLHLLLDRNNDKLLKYVLENYNVDINVKNTLGQTPLFFVESVEVLKLLAAYNPDYTIKDKKGNTWIDNKNYQMIKYAIDNKYISRAGASKAINNLFIQGNFEYVSDFFEDIDPVNNIVSSIIKGLDSNIDKNKYQAVLNLMEHAGIKIPTKFHYLLSSARDDHTKQEFDFIYGLMHKLALYYINLAKHPENLDFIKIENNFDAIYQIVSKALNLLDNDYTKEILVLNDLDFTPLKTETRFFRGIRGEFDSKTIDNIFKYGHRSSQTDNQKILSFYLDEPWSVTNGTWEYGGTYTSTWIGFSAEYTGVSSNDPGIIFEIGNLDLFPKICGSFIGYRELILGTLETDNLIAIYKVAAISNNDNNRSFYVKEVYANPYLQNMSFPSYKLNDKFDLYPDKIDDDYQNLCDLKDYNLVDLYGRPRLPDYKNYNDFIERYTFDKYLENKEKLFEIYFKDRLTYEEVNIYSALGECDLTIECCEKFF